MQRVSAFVGHSFDDQDKGLVQEFLEFFNAISETDIPFSWTHAEKAQAQEVWKKVFAKIDGQNLLISICTAKEFAIPKAAMRSFFGLNFAFSKDVHQKTSDWIIQEIGLARGRGMEVILLVEDDIRVPTGLLGDHEYITFSRTTPSASFKKVLEQITGLFNEKEQLVAKSEDSGRLEPEELDEKEGDLDESNSHDSDESKPKSEDDYIRKISYAILDKDEAAEDKAAKDYRAKFKDSSYHETKIKAMRLYFHAIWNNEENLPRLLTLLDDNPNHAYVLECIARLLKRYKQYSEAANYFEKAAETSEDSGLKLLCEAMVSFAEDKNNEWKRIENQIAKDKDLKNFDKAYFLKQLATIYLNNDDYGVALALREAGLELNPSDHSLRFDLAYQYSERDLYALSLYHYGILIRMNPGPGAWNNYGVALGNLKLSILANNAFRQAEKLDNTLAMSNLASNFLWAGFEKEARDLVKRAQGFDDYDKRVDETASSIAKQVEEEGKKLSELLDSTKPERDFLASFAKARLDTSPPNFNARYADENIVMQVTVKETSFEGIVETTKDRPAIQYVLAKEKGKQIPIKQVYEGKLHGRSLAFTKKSYEDGELSEEGKGWLVISHDQSLISFIDSDLPASKPLTLLTKES